MSAGDALRALARFLDDCEAARSVEAVSLAASPAPDAGALCADVEVVLGRDPEHLDVRDASVDADGGLSLAVAAENVVPADRGRDVDVAGATARVRPDGALAATLAVTVPTDGARGRDRDAGRDRGAGIDGRAAVGGGDAEAPARDDGGSDDAEGGSDGADDPEGEADERAGDRGVPAFRDRERLAAAYESCATFAEMREALGVDVTAETVRRYMIDAGVHQPASYDTDGGGGEATSDDATGDGAGSVAASRDADADPDRRGGRPRATVDRGEEGEEGDADGEGGPDPGPGPDPDTDSTSGDSDGNGDGDAADGTSRDGPGRAAGDEGEPVVLADGVGLPDGVTPDALVDAVAGATTTYEVERRLGLDREETLATLRACDLLDLVAGRLGTATERDVAPGTVRDRLRRAAGTRSRRGSGAGNGRARETGKDGR